MASSSAPVLPARRGARLSQRQAIRSERVEWSVSFLAFLAYVFAVVSFRVPIGTVAMSIALAALPLERRALRFPPMVVLPTVFLAWAAVGMTVSAYPQMVWNAVIEFAKVCGVILVAVNVLTSRPRLRFFLIFLVIVFGAFPVRGTLLNYAGGYTIFGRALWNFIYANPNDLAALCILTLAISLSVLELEKRTWVVWGTRLSIGLLSLVIVLTQSRGALIGLAVLLLIAFKGHWRDVKKVMIGLMLAGLVIAIAPDTVWKRLATVLDATNSETKVKANDKLDMGSSRQRLEIWKVARTMSAEQPLTGVGLGAYSEAHFVYSQRSQFDPTAWGHRDAHSTYLKLLAETGVVGLSLYLALIVLTIRRSRQARKRAKHIAPERGMQLFYLEIGLYGFLVASIWGSYSELVMTYLYLAIMTSESLLLDQEIRRAATPADAPRSMRRQQRPASPGIPLRT